MKDDVNVMCKKKQEMIQKCNKKVICGHTILKRIGEKAKKACNLAFYSTIETYWLI